MRYFEPKDLYEYKKEVSYVMLHFEPKRFIRHFKQKKLMLHFEPKKDSCHFEQERLINHFYTKMDHT